MLRRLSGEKKKNSTPFRLGRRVFLRLYAASLENEAALKNEIAQVRLCGD
jgi:hypothetical protein